MTLPSTDDCVSSSGAVPAISHGLADQPDLELQVNLRALIDLQLDARALDLAKALNLGGERVAARLQRGEDVVAAAPVVAVRLTPVASFVSTTVTPGTTAPEVSRIVPTRSAVVTCAWAIADDTNSRKPRREARAALASRFMPSSLISGRPQSLAR